MMVARQLSIAIGTVSFVAIRLGHVPVEGDDVADGARLGTGRRSTKHLRGKAFAFNEKKGWTVLIAVGILCAAVPVLLLWCAVSLCLRRRFQFSFRSLLAFTVVLSVSLGWFSVHLQRARRQREAIAAIVNTGGLPFYQRAEGDWTWTPETDRTTPAALRKLLGDDFFYDVELVFCADADFCGKDAVHLRRFRHIKWLYLDRTEINDDDLEHLKGLTKLEILSLAGTKVTDEGVEKLKQALPNCLIDY
jgi:hypothetical protein